MLTAMILPDFASIEIWISLLTLTFLEIVLGVDNIIFISISAGKLPDEEQKKATNVGLVLAMALRILLLFGISWLIAMEEAWFELHNSFISGAFSGQSLILVVGGMFLLYKSTTEIHHKLEGEESHQTDQRKGGATLRNVIVQITLINIVFSFDILQQTGDLFTCMQTNRLCCIL